MNRKVLRPVTLSTGLHLPAGTSIAFPSDAVNRDPELYERPSDFDGFRFARLRTKPGSENSFQFTSSNASGFSFGKSDMTSLSTTCISPRISLLLKCIIRSRQSGMSRPLVRFSRVENNAGASAAGI